MQAMSPPRTRRRYLEMIRRMHPLPGADGDVHAVYTTDDGRPLVADDANGAWSAVLGELDALRLTEGTTRNYYGVVRIDYPSGIAGLGYMGRPTAMGYDRELDRSRVMAHELGHNWGRPALAVRHPSGPDPDYPYSGGVIGVYGYRHADQVLGTPSTPDIMGYCGDPWISDYTYGQSGVPRRIQAAIAAAPAADAALPARLGPHREWPRRARAGVRGRDPAQSARSAAGPTRWRGSCRTAGGSSVSRSTRPGRGRPARRAAVRLCRAARRGRAAAIGTLRLAGPGAAVAMARTQAPLAAAQTGDIVQARTVAGGADLRWDTVAHPMLMVRDPDTGEVLSFARGGNVERHHRQARARCDRFRPGGEPAGEGVRGKPMTWRDS